MPSVGFEPTISGGERPQTYALDRAATGTGIKIVLLKLILEKQFREEMYNSELYPIVITRKEYIISLNYSHTINTFSET